VEHRAYLYPESSGTWAGGCEACDTSWVAEPCWHRAAAWCGGHNKALDVEAAGRHRFPRIGPGDAITLAVLRDRIREVAASVGAHAEIVQPVAIPPILCIWTPPNPDGWERERLGTLLIERGGTFIPQTRTEIRAGRHRKEP